MSSIKTAIEWTDKTWNPTTGCTKVSPGCKFCYAETITQRFAHNFPNGFDFTMHPNRLNEPRRWRKPSLVFVNSMSDLFHEEMPLEFLQQIFTVMRECPQHTFQVLTKRHERLLELAPLLEWSRNIWIGVSVENQNYVHRVDYLRQVPAAVRFLSCEPLLGSLELNLNGIRDQCFEQGVAFFHKQWGGKTPKSGGRELDGRTWDEMPVRM
jgi:protein gp37